MTTAAKDVRPIQNIGLIDRVVRFVIGAGVVWFIVFHYEMEHPMLSMFGEVLAVILALYPLWTCNVGWDPFYAVFGIRTGGDTGRNQLGTFPYQVMAALGKSPRYCDISDERSLEACHEKRTEQPLHPQWQVDREPILYPDRETLDEYFRNHPAPPDADASRTTGERSAQDAAKADRRSPPVTAA